MKGKSSILSVLVLAGGCLALAPAWAQQTGTAGPKGQEEKAGGGVQGSQQTPRSPSPGAPQAGKQTEQPAEQAPAQRATRPSTPRMPGGEQEAGGEKQRGESRRDEMGAAQEGQANIKDVQQALKEKGFDPGPIDGVMGPKTRDALKSFQSANNLKATGKLDEQTAQQLGVEAGQKSAMRESEKSEMRRSGRGSSVR